MASQLFVSVVLEALDGGILDGSVRAPGLTVGPRMVGLCQAMLDTVFPAGSIEQVTPEADRWTIAVPGNASKLDAVVGQHCVDPVGDGFDEFIQKGCGRFDVCALHQFGECEPGCPVNCDEATNVSDAELMAVGRGDSHRAAAAYGEGRQRWWPPRLH